MNKKVSLGAAIAFLAIVAAAVFTMTMVYSTNEYNKKILNLTEREKMYDKISEIDGYMRQRYIGTVDENKLRNESARGYLTGSGDVYAEYYGPSQYQLLTGGSANRSVQIGVVTTLDESGYMRVTEVYADSPALAASIQVGDLIVKVDDVDISAENYSESVVRMNGEAGTKMTIVVRKGLEDITLDMTRRYVEIPSVISWMLPDNVGLIQITEFNELTPDQFTRNVDRLIDEGAVALVFDVRGVSVGTLSSVSRVLDKLLPEGVIVSSTDKKGATTVMATSDQREVLMPMSVLMNEKTSGEAELFSVAIKDYEKGKLVGAKTVGKGTMQEIIPLSDGSAIKLTVAKYIPPVSPAFDGEGIKPDFEVKMTDKQLEEAMSPAVVGNPALRVDNDPQLKKAVEIVLTSVRATEIVASSSSQPEITLPEPEPSSSEDTQSAADDESSGDSSDGEDGESSSSEESSSSSGSSSSGRLLRER